MDKAYMRSHYWNITYPTRQMFRVRTQFRFQPVLGCHARPATNNVCNAGTKLTCGSVINIPPPRFHENR